MTIRPGQSASLPFRIDAAQMEIFRKLSEDDGLVHTDAAFARSKGYDDVIVYGGAILAKLSCLLGTMLPGPTGVSLRWSIDYRRPLYVDEPAVLTLEVTDVSPSTGVVEARFKVLSGERIIATGAVQSLVEPGDIEP